jgi:hypothetical protein
MVCVPVLVLVTVPVQAAWTRTPSESILVLIAPSILVQSVVFESI